MPQELGYFIVLGFAQLHASHRRAREAAGGGGGSGLPLRASARSRRPVTRGWRGGAGRGNPGAPFSTSLVPRQSGTVAAAAFPQLRPAARPGRGEPPSRGARLCAAVQAGGEREARGGSPRSGWGEMALACGHRHPRNPRVSHRGGLLPRPGVEEVAGRLMAEEVPAFAPYEPPLAFTSGRAEGGGRRQPRCLRSEETGVRRSGSAACVCRASAMCCGACPRTGCYDPPAVFWP